jgi:hypothetical protein
MQALQMAVLPSGPPLITWQLRAPPARMMVPEVRCDLASTAEVRLERALGIVRREASRAADR